MENNYGIAVEGKIYRKYEDSIKVYTDAGGWSLFSKGDGPLTLDGIWESLQEREDSRDEVVCHGTKLVIEHQADFTMTKQEVVEPEVMPTPRRLMEVFGDAEKDINQGATAGTAIAKTKSAPSALLLNVADQINTEYATFEELEKKATMSMLKIGLLMEHAKRELPHGQFKKWAEANLTIKYRHAHNFRKLAGVFIAAQQIDQGEMLALVNPQDSAKELGDRLRNMAFDFLGDKTQAELFDAHGIKVRNKQNNAGNQNNLNEDGSPKLPPLPPGETATHYAAATDAGAITKALHAHVIGSKASVAHLRMDELKVLQGDLLDAKRIVDELINAG